MHECSVWGMHHKFYLVLQYTSESFCSPVNIRTNYIAPIIIMCGNSYIHKAGIDIVRVFLTRQFFQSYSVVIVYTIPHNLFRIKRSLIVVCYMGRCFRIDFGLCLLVFQPRQKLTGVAYLWPVQWVYNCHSQHDLIAYIVFQLKPLVPVCMHSLHMFTKLIHWNCLQTVLYCLFKSALNFSFYTQAL